MTKNDGDARALFMAARTQQEKTVQAEPNYGPALCVLGLIDAGLGRREEALREGRRAVELVPVEKDALVGPTMIKYLAMIAAWTGDKDFPMFSWQRTKVHLPSWLSMRVPPSSDPVDLQKEPGVCPQCGSASRVGRSLCLSCMLSAGMGANGRNGDSADETSAKAETLDDLLGELDVCDADWRIGNYQILEEIGRGGMGVIYRARQRHSRRIVALKRILSYHADSQETLARFRREAQAAASLDHPNILPIYEVSECDDGLPFFSMKFAGGGSLLEAAPALRGEPRRAVALMAKVSRAVQYAHGQGILHRDLKPGNILLDGRGEPLVSDFGLAKWLDTSSHLTRTLTIFGTPGYIAPEQVNGSSGKLGPVADVYSLGAILFDLLTGHPPFLG